MLEKMGNFFDNRLDSYDEHQLSCIESAREFLNFTAICLPATSGCEILDLGCGTGLELESYFSINPFAHITGIDLAPGMLNRLKEKFSRYNINLVLGSYFEVSFGFTVFDAAVSVESLHHYTTAEKTPLYKKLKDSLKPDGFFILTDYFSLSDEEEQQHRNDFIELKKEQGICDDSFYHFDTPLTVEHEIHCLKNAGFSTVEILNHWGATYCIRAVKSS